MGMKRQKIMKALALVLCTVTTLLLSSSLKTYAATVSLDNPRFSSDLSSATWDCIWFGSYPQTEITASNGSIYTTLKNASASSWDSNGDITISGTKYRRIRKGDASSSSNSGTDGYYTWSDSTTYHYFRYEPIKWRILDIKGDLLLLADQTLDTQKFSKTTSHYDVDWQDCLVRSWLNGYNASMNDLGKDYSSQNFINSAFTASEQNAIANSSILNYGFNNTKAWTSYYTQDKIFLLSSYDLFDDDSLASCYGFHSREQGGMGEYYYDACKRSIASDYAKAMGVRNMQYNSVYYSYWLTRTVSTSSNSTTAATYVRAIHGRGNAESTVTATDASGVRPALYLKSSSLGSCRYAGTVCSDGTVIEKNIAMTTASIGNGSSASSSKKAQTFSYTKTYTKTYGAKAFTLNAKLKTGNGSLTYKSSNTKVATVNKNGKVTIKGTGACTITVKAAETSAYSSKSVTVTIKVKPKKATLITAAVGKKQLKTKWKRDTKADGYQIQYSTSKKFTKKTTTTVSVKKNKTVSKTVKKLKSGRKYYVRVRAYKKATVNGKSTTLYGAWSKPKLTSKIK